MPLDSINAEQSLYVIPCGDGYSCLGFEVANRRIAAVAEWLGRNDLMPTAPQGTAEHYEQYEAAMTAGSQHSAKTGRRCYAELTPALVGKEGKRVEVTYQDGTKTRFYVGKSTGWLPIHLEIKTRASDGGAGAYVPEGATVRVVGAKTKGVA